MYMLTLGEIVKRLKGLDLEQASKEMKMNYQQLWRIRNGIDTNPQKKTLEKLSDYLMEEGEAGSDVDA